MYALPDSEDIKECEGNSILAYFSLALIPSLIPIVCGANIFTSHNITSEDELSIWRCSWLTH